MRTVVTNIGRLVTGALEQPFADADTVVMADGVIDSVGTLSDADAAAADVIIDADGMTALPGLIDSHVHITFGDYTPRQKTVGYLESYLHGGTTTAITASEVHVPGRPKSAAGVMALALAAQACFRDYRPGGMRVHAGSVILEPELTEADLAKLKDAGIWLAKAGFGAFGDPSEYAPLMRAARRLGMVTTMHTGGSSIPGSSGIWAEHVIASNACVSFHVNGGPSAMPEAGFAQLVAVPGIALQICTAGNLRTALLTARLLQEAGELERLLIATDTPTGSGIMPLGMFYTISHLASLGGIAPEIAIAAATGNVADVYRLNSGRLEAGRDADLLLIDACDGSATTDAFDGLVNGDVPGIGAVVTDGVPRFVGRSRNTPATVKQARVAENRLPRDYSGAA